MGHVTKLRERDELPLRQFPMQVLRLTPNIRNMTAGTCDDRERHSQLSVVALQFHR
jgi:hypothetical protein